MAITKRLCSYYTDEDGALYHHTVLEGTINPSKSGRREKSFMSKIFPVELRIVSHSKLNEI